MGDRNPISKKTRFEVFKRDSFRCQYCGRSAPEVILEVDHIKPVSEGGKNTLLNLVTSCRDCNRGKGKRLLSDNEELLKQKAALDDLNEKRIQMEMMVKWKEELEEVLKKQIDLIEMNLIDDPERYRLNQYARSKVRMLINRFGFPLVYESSEIATKYHNTSDRIDKLGGICYNINKNRGVDNPWD